MTTYPTLRERVRDVLLAAGFGSRERLVPFYKTGGTFDLTSGVGVRVQVSWWDATPDERRALLESFAAALGAAGFVVEDRGDVLYVAKPEKRGGEE